MNAINTQISHLASPSQRPVVALASTNQISTVHDQPLTAPAPLDNPAALKTAFGDRCDWQRLEPKLHRILQDLIKTFPFDDVLSKAEVRLPQERALASQLKDTFMPVCEDSSYAQNNSLPASATVSLEAYISGSGLNVPKTLDELLELHDTVTRHMQVHPLGNFSGALSWPVPPNPQEQAAVVALLHGNESGLPGLPLAKDGTGVLGYLLSGSAVTDADLKSASHTLEKLLASPKAQALGLAIQDKLGILPTSTSVNDCVLMALQLSVDPEDNLAGFDLMQRQYWGQPPSAVIKGLADHLVEQGKARPQTAHLAACLLLLKSAPHYLIPGIPPSVTCGSATWTQLTIATAKIEAQTPGRAPCMRYAEVLALAEKLGNDTPPAQYAQHQALRDWGVVNGLLAPSVTNPTPAEMANITSVYNNQLEELKTASTLLQTEIPNRKAMALAKLKQAFPELDPSLFEVRNIQKALLQPGRPGLHPGERSMLDIVMEGDTLRQQEHWVTNDKRLPIKQFCTLSEAGSMSVANEFKIAYDAAIKALEEGHRLIAKYLIAKLPPDQRKDFAAGKLAFFHTNIYQIAMDFFTPPMLITRGHKLHVKTTRGDDVNVYELDTKNGTLEKVNYLKTKYTEPYAKSRMESRDANALSKTVVFDPFKDQQPDQSKEQPLSAEIPQVIGSSRSDYVANVLVKALDMHNDDLLNHAREVTSYDNDSARNAAIGEFFLNLIPFRSAIVNFTKGNYGEGMLDLGLDFIGLVSLGAGKAAQAGKIATRGISTLSGVSKAARFVGAAAIEAVNPLGGIGDLANLARKGGH